MDPQADLIAPPLAPKMGVTRADVSSHGQHEVGHHLQDLRTSVISLTC